MDNPLVSVIIPLHNHANWIEECLKSIDEQTYRNINVIIIDDGSNDKPEEVLGKYIDDFCGFHYVGKTNSGLDLDFIQYQKAHGPSWARNEGVKYCWPHTFAYAFLDSDDLYLPSKIEQSVNVLMNHDEIGVVYSDYYTFFANKDEELISNYKEPFSRQRLLEECIINCDSVVRASAFEAVGGFDVEMRVCEDYDLWIRLTEKYIASHIAEPLIKIRVGNHSSTSSVNKEIWGKNWNRIREKMLNRAKNNNGNQ